MRKISLLVVFAVIAINTAKADWVVVQKSSTDGKDEESTLRIKGEQSRMDIGKEMSIVSNAAEGSVAMLMHGQKMVMKMDAETLKSLSAMAGGALGGDQTSGKPEATGQKEKVGDYDCEIYTWKGALGSGKFWIAKDFPAYQELNSAQDKLMKGLGNVAALMPKASDFPGMAIKSELQIAGKTATSQLVSAKEEAVDAAIFTLPVDYQEMKMPGR